MAKISDYHETTDIINDRLVKVFQSMILQSDFKEALELINVLSDEIPPPSVVNDIIFNILMKDCDEKSANEANAYLNNYLNLLLTKSPSNSLLTKGAFQYDYRAVLQDTSGVFCSIWSAFSHLVESSFIHHNISTESEKSCPYEVIKFPNCDILIEFFTQMLIKFLSLENDLFEDDPGGRFSVLLEWINKVYKLTDQRIAILDVLHMLLDNKVKHEVLSSKSSKKMYALSNLILNKCPDIFNSAQNIKGFNARSNLPHLHEKIYHLKLHKLIYKKKLLKKKHRPLTLKTIIQNYFFYPNSKEENKTKPHKPSVPLTTPKKTTITKGQLKKIFSKDETEGDSILHKFCRANKFGDLLEFLQSSYELDPNVTNSAQRTPLHEACLFKSFYCAKSLLEDLKEDSLKVDLKAADKNGLTPLHCAAYMDSVEIARMLLKHGGAHLVTLEDNFGEKAIKYATSESMKKLLKDFVSKIQESTSEVSSLDFDKDHLTVPTMKDKEEYSIFLFGLHTILYHYLERSNLLNYKKGEADELSHEHRKCLHFVLRTSTAVCDDDAFIFKSLPLFLDRFLACIQSDAEKIDVNIRINTLSLVLLRKMLDSTV